MDNLRVLLVDDESAAREAIAALLQQLPAYELAGEADSGAQALALLKTLKPDIMLIDIVMPGMSGLQLIARARELAPDVQMILLTMHRDFSYAVEALRLGALDYLIKDAYNGQQLFVALEKARDRIAAQRGRADFEWDAVLEAAAREQKWRGTCGRYAAFLDFPDVRFAYARQNLYLQSMRLFAECYPIAPGEWVVTGGASDEAVRAALSAMLRASHAIHMVFSRPMRFADASALANARSALGEQFYFPNSVVVSGMSYAAEFAPGSFARWKEGFRRYMQGKWEEFPGELVAECLEKHIAPEGYRELLAAFVLEWGGSTGDAREIAAQIRATHSAHEAQLLLGSFALRERLSAGQKEIPEIQRVKQYIAEHLADDLSLPVLARHIGLSPSYLSATFKRQTGEGLKHYIVKERLAAAADKLIHTHMRVYEIASACGFANARYFSSTFFRAYGMMPQAYRRKAWHE